MAKSSGGGGGGGGLSGGSSGAAYSGGGGGSLSGGSSGAASSRDVPSAAMSEAERKRLEELLRQQQAVAAASQQASITGVPSAPAPPVPGAPPPAVPPPGATPAVAPVSPPPVMTPYGPIATTNPQGQERLEQAVNPLVQERPLNSVQQAAQNYRDLVRPGGSPAQAFAKQQYANALNEKAAGLRQIGAEREYARTLGLREDRIAGQARQALGPQATPEQQNQAEAQARESYRTLTPEQQKSEYYNQTFLVPKGINPNDIGGAQTYAMAGGGRGLNVPSPEVAAAARNDVNEATKRTREMLNQERALRNAKDPKDRVLANQVRKERVAFENESKLQDPLNPTVGMNTDAAYRKAVADRLSGGGSTLRGVAKEAKKTEQKSTAENPAQESQRELAELAERERLEKERWLEEQREKRFASLRY